LVCVINIEKLMVVNQLNKILKKSLNYQILNHCKPCFINNKNINDNNNNVITIIIIIIIIIISLLLRIKLLNISL